MNVVIAGVSMELPPQVVTTDELEARLAPLYQRIGLVPGRLELMTGIKERRFWNTPIKPSEIAARAGKKALAKAQLRHELRLDEAGKPIIWITTMRPLPAPKR